MAGVFTVSRDGQCTVDEFEQEMVVSMRVIERQEDAYVHRVQLDETPDGDRVQLWVANGRADYAVLARERLEYTFGSDDVLRCRLVHARYYDREND